MSDEIQVRSKCTNDCVNGTTSHDYGNGNFELHTCIVCSGKGYTYKWITFKEAGIQQPAEATA